MPWWTIPVLIIIILLGFYIAGVFVYAYQMDEYHKRIAKNLQAIDVLIVQKYDLLRRVGKLFVAADIQVPTEFIIDIRPNFETKLQNISLNERVIIKAFLMRTAQALFYYGEMNKELASNSDYIGIKEEYAEIDHQYRTTINLYNADAIGYNYWMRLFWFRWIAKSKKLVKKDIIS